jgi:hypothetical protein
MEERRFLESESTPDQNAASFFSQMKAMRSADLSRRFFTEFLRDTQVIFVEETCAQKNNWQMDGF